MSKSEPTIKKYMSSWPQTITEDKTVEEAMDLMEKKHIRHLPVMRKDTVIGIISDRDVKLATSIEGIDVKHLPVYDICVEKPYTVDPDATVSSVAKTMASKRYGCVIVVDNQNVVGIFTTVDACRALADVIETRHRDK